MKKKQLQPATINKKKIANNKHYSNFFTSIALHVQKSVILCAEILGLHIYFQVCSHLNFKQTITQKKQNTKYIFLCGNSINLITLADLRQKYK